MSSIEQSETKPIIVLAVGGGIAAYKSAILCSRLAQAGCDVRVAMTQAATEFIGVATLSALSGHPVALSSFEPQTWPLGPHIECLRGASLMVVAPATANLLAQFATGAASDLVSTMYLQAECPVLLAPAMSNVMWSKASVQRNVKQLQADGCHFVGPDEGWLSCRQSGAGRMSEPDEIVKAIERLITLPSKT